MFSRLRDRRGGPSPAVRLLALVVALLLAGPLVALVARVLVGVVRLAL